VVVLDPRGSGLGGAPRCLTTHGAPAPVEAGEQGSVGAEDHELVAAAQEQRAIASSADGCAAGCHACQAPGDPAR